MIISASVTVGAVFAYIGGILLAVMCFAILYGMLMWMYKSLRKKMSGAKFLPEFLTLLIVAIVNIAVKFVLVFFNVDGTEHGAHEVSFGFGIMDIFRSIYTGIGNFTFEGVEGLYDSGLPQVLGVFYYGSTLLTAIVFASVIVATASYEAFTRLSIFLSKIFRKKCDYYVFTALTEETILLAESIKKEEAEDAKGDGKKKARDSVIIFAGPALDAFDRKNELCRRVMANGFLYWSYNETERSIIKVLGLKVSNGLNSLTKGRRNRLVIFSFNAQDHVPEEEANMDFVFTDISRRIKEVKTKERNRIDRLLKTPFVEYYVLTEREINYQAYQFKIENFRAEIRGIIEPVFIKKLRAADPAFATAEDAAILKAPFDPALWDKKDATFLFFRDQGLTNGNVLTLFTFIANVSVWNEATAISYSAVEAFQRVLNRYPDDVQDFFGKDIHVCSIGYGLTAQTIVKNLYVQTAFIKAVGDPSDPEKTAEHVSTFNVEAFDPSSEDIAGLLQYENPMCVCVGVEKPGVSIWGGNAIDVPGYGVIMTQAKKDRIAQSVKNIQEEINAVSHKKLGEGRAVMSNDDEICPLTIAINKYSVLDFDLVKQLDAMTGTGDSQVRPNFITIATGDDYRNIKVANALILDILKENSGKKQIIFMNVWDEKNLALINRYNRGSDVYEPSTEYEEIRGAKVFRYTKDVEVEENNKTIKKRQTELILIVVGNNTEIYSAKSVIEYDEIATYAVNYNRATDMFGLTMDLPFAVGALQADIDRYVKFGTPRTDEKGKAVIGVRLPLADAVNAVVADYTTGKTLPFDHKTLTDILHSFCKLSTAKKDALDRAKQQAIDLMTEAAKTGKKLPLQASDDTLVRILLSGDNASRIDGFSKFIDHVQFYIWQNWCAAGLWDKESNMSAYMFGYVYKRLLAQKKAELHRTDDDVLTFEDLVRILNIEHQRWMRVHMCNGWSFGAKVKGRRIHNCLLPLYAIADRNAYSYDLINAAWGMVKE